MRFDFSILSSAGPRKTNEDAVECWRLPDDSVLAAVADGLGGMGGGRCASVTAIEAVAQAVNEGRVSFCELLELVKSVHKAIQIKQAESPELRSMATTLSLVRLWGTCLQGVHCGDTRIMVARGRGIKRLTRDQTEVQRLLEEGQISANEYRDYPRKNVLYSALGSTKEPVFERIEFQLEPGDWVLLTSDGVHQRVGTAQLRDIALSATSASVFVQMVESAVEECGALDNFSVAAIRAY